MNQKLEASSFSFYLYLTIWKHQLIALLQVEPIALHSVAGPSQSSQRFLWALLGQCINVKVLASMALRKCVFLKLPLKIGQISGFNLPGPSRQWDDSMKDLWDVPCTPLKSISSQLQWQNLILVAVTSGLSLYLVAPSESHNVNVYCLLFMGLWLVFWVSCNAVRRASRAQSYNEPKARCVWDSSPEKSPWSSTPSGQQGIENKGKLSQL